ncbi:MAG: hypothetical protein R8K22_00335 [Mariprofundaceae bacterium]
MASLMLSSCALHNKPLQTRIHTGNNIIDVAKLEIDSDIKIRRFNLLFGLMGSSGMLLENAAMMVNRDKYQKKAGLTGKQCSQAFQAMLIKKLKATGYSVRDTNISYWDYYKQRNNELRQTSGGLLRIRLKQVGFWASGIRSPYVPSIIAFVELIEPRSRKILYRTRFAIGFKETEQKIFSYAIGHFKLVNHPETQPLYKDMHDLLDNISASQGYLLRTMEFAASHIVQELEQPTPHFLAMEEISSKIK